VPALPCFDGYSDLSERSIHIAGMRILSLARRRHLAF
jgi:hypothetical protein